MMSGQSDNPRVSVVFKKQSQNINPNRNLWLSTPQGLPYAFGKLGMRAKVYATLPVWKMGQMTVYDAYLSRTHEGNFEAFDLDDVDAAFARFKTLKYSQHLTFSVSEPKPGGWPACGCFVFVFLVRIVDIFCVGRSAVVYVVGFFFTGAVFAVLRWFMQTAVVLFAAAAVNTKEHSNSCVKRCTDLLS